MRKDLYSATDTDKERGILVATTSSKDKTRKALLDAELDLKRAAGQSEVLRVKLQAANEDALSLQDRLIEMEQRLQGSLNREKTLQEENGNLMKHLDSLEAQLACLKAKDSQKDSRIESLMLQMAELDAATDEIKAFAEVEIFRAKEKTGAAEGSSRRLQARLEQMQEEAARAERRFNVSGAGMAAALKSMEAELFASQEEAHKAKLQAQTLNREMEALKASASVREGKKDVEDDLKVQLSAAQQQIASLKAQLNTPSRELNGMKVLLQRVSAAASAKDTQVDSLKQQLRDIQEASTRENTEKNNDEQDQLLHLTLKHENEKNEMKADHKQTIEQLERKIDHLEKQVVFFMAEKTENEIESKAELKAMHAVECECLRMELFAALEKASKVAILEDELNTVSQNHKEEMCRVRAETQSILEAAQLKHMGDVEAMMLNQASSCWTEDRVWKLLLDEKDTHISELAGVLSSCIIRNVMLRRELEALVEAELMSATPHPRHGRHGSSVAGMTPGLTAKKLFNDHQSPDKNAVSIITPGGHQRPVTLSLALEAAAEADYEIKHLQALLTEVTEESDRRGALIIDIQNMMDEMRSCDVSRSREMDELKGRVHAEQHKVKVTEQRLAEAQELIDVLEYRLHQLEEQQHLKGVERQMGAEGNDDDDDEGEESLVKPKRGNALKRFGKFIIKGSSRQNSRQSSPVKKHFPAVTGPLGASVDVSDWENEVKRAWEAAQQQEGKRVHWREENIASGDTPLAEHHRPDFYVTHEHMAAFDPEDPDQHLLP